MNPVWEEYLTSTGFSFLADNKQFRENEFFISLTEVLGKI